jgi:hypothetical protein
MSTTQIISTQLLANDPSANDNFGRSVAINGTTAIVSSANWSQKTPTSIANCGTAYVYINNNNIWTLQAQLLATDRSAGDNFGASVGISGDTVVIGAFSWDQKTPTSITNCGAVYIFIRNGTSWTQQAQLLINNPSANDFFGIKVGIDGNTIIAGSPLWSQKTPTSIGSCGTAYIFTRSGTTWTQQAQLLADDPSYSDSFGISVSINNDTALIGAYQWSQKTPTSLTNCGAAYVFIRNGTTWTLQAKLLANDRSAGDYFGISVSNTGDTAVIGSYRWSQKTPTSITTCGAAYVFIRNVTTWTQQAQLLANDPSAGDALGYTTSIYNDTIIIGSYPWSQKTPISLTNCGSAYVFVKNVSTWVQQNQLLAYDPSANDQFGFCVAINNNTVIVSANQWSQKTPTTITKCGATYITNLGNSMNGTSSNMDQYNYDIISFDSNNLIKKKYNWNIQYNNTPTTQLYNIGIGTTTATRTLDIFGDLNISGDIYINNQMKTLWFSDSNSYSNNIIFNDSNNIGIGTDTPQYKIDVNGVIRANSYLTASDFRLKTNIQNEYLGLDYIKQLKPKIYNYINDTKTKHGFIAQEMIYPEFIYTY